jgi:hypothetical protein
MYLPVMGIFLAAIISAACFWRFHENHIQERRLRQLEHDVLLADGIRDNRKAVSAYESLNASAPEIQLRILQRQWGMAMEILEQVNRVKYNATLADDAALSYDKILAHLDGMRDRCGAMLAESVGLPGEITWQAYNISAAARLLTAYVTLETEKNWPKAQQMIKESLSDLKLAIDAVDAIPGKTPEKNIPRWNMELLYDQQYVEKFTLFNPENQNRMDLNDNLEMLIPERGGYAPGEPADRSVKK